MQTRVKLRDLNLYVQSLSSNPEMPKSPGLEASSLPACTISKCLKFVKSSCSHDPKTFITQRGHKNLPSNLFALCPYKIIERLIHARVKPVIDPLLAAELAGFWSAWEINRELSSFANPQKY